MNKKIIMSLLSASLILTACGSGSSTSTSVNSQKSTAHTATSGTKLKRNTSDQALEDSIKTLMIETYGKIAPPVIIYSTAEIGTTATDSTSSYSSTNTQESSVDEADRLKNNADYLYVASNNTPSINVYSTANGKAKLHQKVKVATENAQSISGLYLTDSKLVSLAGNNSYFWDQWFSPNFWGDRSTQIDLFDTKEGKLSKANTLKIDGQLISSRRIDSTLYLATRHTPTLKGLYLYPSSEQEVTTNRKLIEAATLSDFLPDYSLDGSNKGDVLAASNCFTIDNANSNAQASIINVLSIDLNDKTATPQGSCFVGNAEALYVSSTSLYLATTQYNYQTDSAIAVYNPDITTDIHKFALDNTTIDYKGSAEVEGHLGWQQDLKSFRMGETGDTLGIITYTGNRQDPNTSPAKLFMLAEDSTQEDSLKILSQLPNSKHPEALGKPGEQIYATRFFGDKAYLVTFRTTDPLYILDISNPSDPFVASELEINGYSDYLHPVGENFVLGIGKDAIPANTEMGDARGAWYQGVKLSLIDVSNPQSPYERAQIKIGKRGTNTAVSNTHHAFTSLLKDTGDMHIALPISVHSNDLLTGDETASTFHDWQYDALFRYDINTYTGNIAQRESIKIENTKQNTSHSLNDRSAIIGDTIYYLHGDDILSKEW